MRWKNLVLPKEVVTEELSENQRYARFVLEPLERGFGVTIGNALRRILLSAIQGAAVTSLRIEGVQHEFSTIPGVYEDVTQIVLNLKKLRLKMHSDDPKILTLPITGKGKYTAGMIEVGPDIEILNPDLHIIELTEDKKFKIEIDVDLGRGYVLADQNKRPDKPVGSIFVDSLFSPVIKVNYTVENTRVGQRTDYDRLTLEVTTDGSLTPEESIGYSAKLLADHLRYFIHIDEDIVPVEEKKEDEETVKVRNLLNTRVDELELSVRSSNCLRAANIQTLRDLVQRSESDMLKYRNFGRKSLTELTAILEELGLSWGMDLSRYQSADQN
ncbi:MAG: DNA-directed RNA polymerase subunit alpha [candidate division Zixibacteria bacterium]|nr:DNA-directed RNA polymerase subunit alpha [candidate division Zixibacteria bacterium]